jgi:hypothetical protein
VLFITSYPSSGFISTVIHAVYHSRESATHNLHEMMNDEQAHTPCWTFETAHSHSYPEPEEYLVGYTLRDVHGVVAKVVKAEKADFGDGLGVVVRRL